MKGKERLIGLVLVCIMATGLIAEADIPSEVDPASGKLEFSITLTTLTGRGFDLPLVFRYKSDVWNYSYISLGASAWLKGPTPYGLGWNCNLGGRTFRLGLIGDPIHWYFVGNDNSPHPFDKYDPYYSDIYGYRTTDNTQIRIAWLDFESGASYPTLPNGVRYDSSTSYRSSSGYLFADDGVSGYRYHYIQDPNGNRPFYFSYDSIIPGSAFSYHLLRKIEGLEDTALFCYSKSPFDSLFRPPLLDSVVVRSNGDAKVFRFFISVDSTDMPDGWGSTYEISYADLDAYDHSPLPLLDSITMDGDILYRFSHNDEGELQAVENRSGGKKEYFYGTHTYWEVDDGGICWECKTRRVDSVRVTPRSGETYTWKYEAQIESYYRNPDLVKVKTPTGGEVQFDLYANECDDDCTDTLDGLVKEMRVYSEAPSKLLYKTESFWKSDRIGEGKPRCNSRIDSTVTTWINQDGGDDYFTSTRVLSADKYGNPLRTIYRAGTLSNYDWYDTKYKYYYASHGTYEDLNMVRLLSDEYLVWNSDNDYLKRTAYYYDGVDPDTYGGSPEVWVDPEDSPRGNLTKVITYGKHGIYEGLGEGGDSSQVEYRYDQFGNQVMAIGYPSCQAPETTFTRYSNSNHYAFPARTVNHVSSNADSLYTVTKWDFHRGLPDTTWGFNGQWTAYTYDDFDRVLTVSLQGEDSIERHHYYETQTPPYQIDSVKLDNTRWLVSRTYTDGFGATIQTQEIDNLGSKTLITDYSIEIDEGRSRVSNTREVAQALSSYQIPNWGSLKKTTSYFDILGRDTLSIDQTGNETWTQYGVTGDGLWTLVTVENDTDNYWRSWTKTVQDEMGRTKYVIHGGKHDATEEVDTTFFSYYYNIPIPLTALVKNPKVGITRYYYDKAMRLAGINGPDVGADTFYVIDNDSIDVDVLITYDDMGRVIEKTATSGTVKTDYDEMGRVTLIRVRDAGDAAYGSLVEMRYDSTANARGKLSESKMYAVRCIRYDYDQFGRMTVKDVRMPFFSKWKTLKYTYNKAGLLTHLIYPEPDTGSVGDTVKYFYDNFGRLDSVPGFVKNIHYGTNGLTDSVSYWNGVYTAYNYNDRLGLTQIRTRKSGSPNYLASLSHAYQENGLIRWISDTRNNNHIQTYTYDYRGQLAKFSSAAAADTFSYDGAGNRTYQDNNAYYYADSTNRLDSIPAEGWFFAYDSSGNMMSEINDLDSLFFEYDALDRLTEYRNHSMINPYDPEPGDTIINYVYGGAGDLRARKRFRVCSATLESAGPFLNMIDGYNDLVLNATGFDSFSDPTRDISGVYVRNSTDTLIIAIFTHADAVDPIMSTCNFMIAIDNDRVEGSGEARLPVDTMTLLPPDAWWEYCFYLMGPDSIGSYDTSGTQHCQPVGISFGFKNRHQLDGSFGCSAIDTAYVLTISKNSIPLDSILRIVVFSFRPHFTNDNEYLNGGSSASDVVPGDAWCMSEGMQEGYDEVFDPDPNDPDPGQGYRFTEYYRIYLYSQGLTPLVEYSAPYGGEFDHAPVRYVYGFPGAVARIATTEEGRDTFFLHKDANGSVRSVTDNSGTEVAAYWYDPFGNIIDSTGSDTANTRRFTGKDLDFEHGMIYMAARYYDPRFGRFSSRDPEHTPMSPYAYCLNNPVSFVDPTGHSIGGSGCGGCYTAYFSQNYWKLAYYASMPQLPLVSDPDLSFGTGNPIFTTAAGESLAWSLYSTWLWMTLSSHEFGGMLSKEEKTGLRRTIMLALRELASEEYGFIGNYIVENSIPIYVGVWTPEEGEITETALTPKGGNYIILNQNHLFDWHTTFGYGIRDCVANAVEVLAHEGSHIAYNAPEEEAWLAGLTARYNYTGDPTPHYAQGLLWSMQLAIGAKGMAGQPLNYQQSMGFYYQGIDLLYNASPVWIEFLKMLRDMRNYQP